jgi:hypothetical protein
MDRTTLIREIMRFVQEHGGLDGSWYVGISQDARASLFSEHHVSEADGTWVYKVADSFLAARQVEDYFVNNFRTDGGPVRTDLFATHVYAYRKTNTTKP